jgi:RNA polymerase sigma-70 factor, ECF subfamily
VEAVRGESIESLVRKYFGRVRQFCRSLLHDEADAEDACQEVFLLVARRKDELPGIIRPVPWLLQIARLTCLSARRRRDRFRAVAPESEVDVPVEAGPPVAATEDAAKIREASARLPERYQAVLALHYQQGLSHEEMAEVLQVSRGAVRVLLHRAVARLRQEVKRP